MRVLVAGATGAVGRSLIPELRCRGHEVFGTTRNLSKADVVSASGAQPVRMDGLDPADVFETVRRLQPEAIIHQMTSLENTGSLRNFDRVFELTNQLRTRGTGYLIDAARQAGTRHLIVQSFTGWPAPVADSRCRCNRLHCMDENNIGLAPRGAVVRHCTGGGQ